MANYWVTQSAFRVVPLASRPVYLSPGVPKSLWGVHMDPSLWSQRNVALPPFSFRAATAGHPLNQRKKIDSNKGLGLPNTESCWIQIESSGSKAKTGITRHPVPLKESGRLLRHLSPNNQLSKESMVNCTLPQTTTEDPPLVSPSGLSKPWQGPCASFVHVGPRTRILTAIKPCNCSGHLTGNGAVWKKDLSLEFPRKSPPFGGQKHRPLDRQGHIQPVAFFRKPSGATQ